MIFYGILYCRCTLKSETQCDVAGLRQISKAIIAAFRVRNVLAKMVLDEIFEALKTDEDEMVKYISYAMFLCLTIKSRISSTTGIIQFGCDYQTYRTFE